MKPVCEVIVKEVLPVVRALVAKRLIDFHGLSQNKAAFLLGMTQPAISQYKRQLRGYRAGLFKNYPKIQELINDLAKKIAFGEVREEELTIEFCKICKILRSEEFVGILCEAHKKFYPSLENCKICYKEPKDL